MAIISETNLPIDNQVNNAKALAEWLKANATEYFVRVNIINSENSAGETNFSSAECYVEGRDYKILTLGIINSRSFYITLNNESIEYDLGSVTGQGLYKKIIKTDKGIFIIAESNLGNLIISKSSQGNTSMVFSVGTRASDAVMSIDCVESQKILRSAPTRSGGMVESTMTAIVPIPIPETPGY